MDKEIIRAYLWQDVIRLGFCPSGEKEQKKWLKQYLESLKSFLGLGSYPAPPKSNSKIIFSYSIPIRLDIQCTITKTKTDDFTVIFLYLPPSNNWAFMWDHEVDGKFFTFPVQKFLNHHNQRKLVVKKFSDEDIKVVLDGLIFHPAAHQHIEYPPDKHEIRIGGGIGNVFQFLFHLRYQFCPDKEKREAEEKRLIRLFADAVREKSDLLPINRLMAHT